MSVFDALVSPAEFSPREVAEARKVLESDSQSRKEVIVESLNSPILRFAVDQWRGCELTWVQAMTLAAVMASRENETLKRCAQLEFFQKRES